MRYLDKILETLEKRGPRRQTSDEPNPDEPNPVRDISRDLARSAAADRVGDKLDAAYLSKHTRTDRDSTNDRKQDRRLRRLSATAKESQAAIDRANARVPQAHLRGKGKGDGKPRGKLRLVQSAFYQQVGSILAEITYSKRDDSILTARAQIKHAKKMRAASSAAMDSRERDNRPYTQEQWVDALKSYKTLNNPETKANADKPTTREQSS